MIKAKQIQVKNKQVLKSLLTKKYNSTLIEITEYVIDNYGVFITEGYREALHPYDVHATNPVRALDLRYRVYPKETAYKIRDEINQKWQYDSDRSTKRCCIIHKVKGGKIHFHLQVHPNTRRTGI